MDRSLKIFWKVLCCSGTAVWQLSFEVKSRRDYSPATSVAGDQKKFFGIRLFFPLLETRGAAFLVATSTSFCISAVGAALTRVLCADWSSVYMGIRRDNRIDICDEFLLASWPCKKWLCPISRCGLVAISSSTSHAIDLSMKQICSSPGRPPWQSHVESHKTQKRMHFARIAWSQFPTYQARSRQKQKKMESAT